MAQTWHFVEEFHSWYIYGVNDLIIILVKDRNEGCFTDFIKAVLPNPQSTLLENWHLNPKIYMKHIICKMYLRLQIWRHSGYLAVKFQGVLHRMKSCSVFSTEKTTIFSLQLPHLWGSYGFSWSFAEKSIVISKGSLENTFQLGRCL